MKTNTHNIDITFKDFLIFNDEGNLILQKKFSNESKDNSKLNKIINKIVFQGKKLDFKSKDNFHFFKINFQNYRLLFMSNHKMIFVISYGTNTRTYIAKMYLLHIFTAFVNFIGDYVNISKVESNSQENMTRDSLHIRLFEVS